MTARAQADGSMAGEGARIGPNAIVRMAEALAEREGDAVAEAIFRAAGLGAYLESLPDDMVAESEVARLHDAAVGALGPTRAADAAARAGALTGDYLLAHRIPPLAQRVLRALPAPLAARALLAAIARHAWTFCGSARYAARAGAPTRVTLDGGLLRTGSPANPAVASYYAATFERLFRALVDRDIAATAALSGDGDTRLTIALARRPETGA